MPDARITLLGLPSARAFASRFSHYIDDLLDFPGYPGLPEQRVRASDIPGFLSTVQTRNFDLAIQMHGDGSISNPLTALLGARNTAGFFGPGSYCPDPELFLPYPSGLPEIRRHLELMGFLGFPSKGEDLEFPLFAEDLQGAGKIDEAGYLEPGGYVCIHPGARAPSRRWPPERFAAVADALVRQGLGVVLTGSEDETPLVATVARAMKTTPLDLAGRTTLGVLGAVLAGSRLLICNDTGVSHIADALRVPSVVVFSASDPSRWAPQNRQRHRAVCQPVDCAPCGHVVCPKDNRCALEVSPQAVLLEAERILRREHLLQPAGVLSCTRGFGAPSSARPGQPAA